MRKHLYCLLVLFLALGLTTTSRAQIIGSSTVCVGAADTLVISGCTGSWISENPAIATVNSDGVVYGIATGTTRIVVEGCGDSLTITVAASPSVPTATSATVCQGGVDTLHDGIAGGTWSSSNTSVATIGSAGGLRGVNSGTTTITYSIDGCTALKIMTVTAAPAISPHDAAVCTGSTTDLTDGTSGGTWISATTTVARIGSTTGVVTGVTAGTDVISYITGTTGNYCVSIDSITVSTGPGAITPGGGTICVGSSTTFTNTTPGGIWSSSNTSIATVGTTAGSTTVHVYGASPGIDTIKYNLGSCTATVLVTVNNAPTAISPNDQSICAGGTLTLTDGTTGGSWLSESTSIATLGSTSGNTTVVTGGAAGTDIVQYAIGSCIVYDTVTITTGGAGTISPAGAITVCNGTTTLLSDATSASGVWSSTNTSVATVNSGGTVTGVTNGTSVIEYAVSGCVASKVVTVNGPVAISPSLATTCNGGNTPFTDATSGGIWVSGTTSVATVSASGTVYGVTAGTSVISYIQSSCVALATVDVTNAAGTISPATTTVCEGSGAILTDTTSGGAWSSQRTTVATVNSSGTVTGATAGTTLITYTVGSCYTTTTVSVVASSAITPATASVCVGSHTTLTESGSTGSWSSSNTAVATVTAAGAVYGASPGTATISYDIYSGVTLLCSYSAEVTVNTAPVAISPATTSVCAGSTTTLSDATSGGSWSSLSTATATVSGGTVYGVSHGTATIEYSIGSCSVTSSVTVVNGPAAISPSATGLCIGTSTLLTETTTGGTWSSNATGVATVAGGTVHGVAAGTAVISYIAGSCYSTAMVTVNNSPVAINPSSAVSICSGNTTTLTEATTGGAWSSDNTAVATVSGGIVTGVSAGSAVISYTIGSCFAIKTVTVVTGPSAITASSSEVCTGTGLSLADAASGGTWSSSSTANATVSSSGEVYGVTPGTTIIDYVLSGCSQTTTVTVVASPGAISPTSGVLICAGAMTTLTDATTGGEWSSNATGTATVSTGGTVTGIAAGTAIISYTGGTCAATRIVTVSLGPTAISPSSPTTCAGSTIALSDGVGGGVWSSSSTAVATVNSGGTVTGVTAGTVSINYVIGSCTTTTIVTITPAPSVGTIEGSTFVCLGSTTPLTDAASDGAWSSNNTAVASVTSSGLVYGVGAGTALISYSNTSSCGVVATTLVVSVNSSPSAGTIAGASTLCAGATETLSNTVTGGTWSASNANATVNRTTGFLTGVSTGLDTITYKVTTPCGIASTTFVVTVGAYLSGGAITASASTLCGGSTVTLSDAIPSGSWTSSNTSATVNSSGIVTGAAAGGIDTISYTVTESCGAAVATYILTINPSPVAGSISGGVSTVCIGTPITLTESASGGIWAATNGNATVTDGVVTGVSAGTDTIYYTVTNGCGSAAATLALNVSGTVTAGTISGGSTICLGTPDTLTDAVAGGVWTSSNTNATVSGAGVVNGVSAGSATISYTVTSSCGTAIATLSVTVSGSSLSAGSILGPSTLCIGSYSIYTDAAGGGIWSVSNSTASVVSTGIVTGITAGIDTVFYTVSNTCGTAIASQVVTISTSVLTAGTISGLGDVCLGSSETLTESIGGGAWSSSNANATITSGGSLTGVSSGADTIYYTVTTGCGTASAAFDINVGTPTAGTIIGGPGVCAGYPVLFTDAIAGGTWSMSNTHASVSSTGLVTGATVGTDTIRYTITTSCGIAYTTKAITIGTSPGVAAITGSSTLCNDYYITLSDATSSGTWSTTATATAVVGSNTGVVTGISTGTAVISYSVTYSCGVASVSKTVTVNASTGITPIGGADTVCQGATINLTEATSGGTWSSGSVNAIVSSGGVVTGEAAGTATISYTMSGGSCGTISEMTVIDIAPTTSSMIGPISSLSIVCVGSGITLVDPTPGGTWVASNGNAIVVGAGIIDGVSQGTDTISYMVNGSCGIGSVSKILSVDTIPVAPAITGTAAECLGGTTTLSNPTLGGIWTTNSSAIATVDLYTGVVTGITVGSTIITYTITNAYGCPGSAIVTDNVEPVSISTPITGSSSVCIGSSVSLSNTTAGGVWSSSNTAVATIDPVTGSLTGVTSGTTTVAYTVTDICGTSFTSAIETVGTPPSISAITGPSTGCVGSPVTLADATSGGVWSSDNTSIATVNPTSGAVTGTGTGSVDIIYTITGASGCAATADAAVFINAAPAVDAITGTSFECAGLSSTLADGTGGGAWSSSNTSVSTVDGSGNVYGVAGGVDTISYIVSGSGCPGIASIVNIVSGAPSVSAISGAASVCDGSTTSLADATAGGLWSATNTNASVSGGLVTGISDGVDTVYYTVSNSCGTTSAQQIISIISTPPTVSAITGNDSVCLGETVMLSDSVAGGIWVVSNANASVTGSGIVTGERAGNDTITYAVSNACGSANATITIIVEACGGTGVNGVTSNEDVRIYPNPATSMLHIESASQVNVSVTTIDGKTLLHKDNATDIDVAGLADGMYIIMVYNQDNVLVKTTKFVKEQ